MKKIVLFVSVVFATQFGFSQKTTFKEDVIKFFEIQGFSKDSYQNQVLPIIDKSKHEDFKKEFAVYTDNYYTIIAEVYQEEFSQAEIKKLTSLVKKSMEENDDAIFLSSTIGKKFVEKRKILEEKLFPKLTVWESDLNRMFSKYKEITVEYIGGSGEGTGSGTGGR